MRLQKYLIELFSKRTDWKISNIKEKVFDAEFMVNESLFSVSCYQFDDEDDAWEVSFEDEGSEDIGVTDMQKESAMMVFSYVISIIKYFIETYNPNKILINPATPEQEEIYDKMIEKMEKTIDKYGYKLTSNKWAKILLKRR